MTPTQKFRVAAHYYLRGSSHANPDRDDSFDALQGLAGVAVDTLNLPPAEASKVLTDFLNALPDNLVDAFIAAASIPRVCDPVPTSRFIKIAKRVGAVITITPKSETASEVVRVSHEGREFRLIGEYANFADLMEGDTVQASLTFDQFCEALVVDLEA